MNHHERVTGNVVTSSPIFSLGSRTNRCSCGIGREGGWDADCSRSFQDSVRDRRAGDGSEPGFLSEVEPEEGGEEVATKRGHEEVERGFRG